MDVKKSLVPIASVTSRTATLMEEQQFVNYYSVSVYFTLFYITDSEFID